MGSVHVSHYQLIVRHTKISINGVAYHTKDGLSLNMSPLNT